ncbi:hypothetical protein V6N13_011951 [Hibiscus sabdariffa]|uniref:Uncharacterized protein n=1 Tax=Hibiscus sabdariffa TaxID=183260 RepID=A0ABR1ZGV4_9ROSI
MKAKQTMEIGIPNNVMGMGNGFVCKEVPASKVRLKGDGPAMNDMKTELLDPAVKGTLNVLNSCANTSSVKTVILTSSVAAVTYNGKPPTPDVVVDGSWFTDPEYHKSLKMRFILSKVISNNYGLPITIVIDINDENQHN